MVADINSVDENLRSLYVEKDGKFVLNVTPIEGYALENVNGLKSALSAERSKSAGLETTARLYEGVDPAAARDALAKIKDFGDLDPTKAREAIETATRLAAFDPEKESDKKAEEKLKNAKSQLTAAFATEKLVLDTENKTLKETLARRESQVKALLKDNAIKESIAKLNPLDDARDAVELLVSKNVRLKEVDGSYTVEVTDEHGNARIKDHLGTPFTITDYMAEFREKRPSLFKADERSGAGITPGTAATKPSNTSANPWKQGTFNMTQQMVLLKSNPTLAAQMKRDAGVA